MQHILMESGKVYGKNRPLTVVNSFPIQSFKFIHFFLVRYYAGLTLVVVSSSMGGKADGQDFF